MTSPPIAPDVALRAFEADAAFSAALAELQEQAAAGLDVHQSLLAANRLGFSWQFTPSTVVVRHRGGADEQASTANTQPLPTLLGLLGLTALQLNQAGEPEASAAKPACSITAAAPTDAAAVEAVQEPEPEPAAAAAAASLAAATAGQVVDPSVDWEQLQRPQDDPLTEDEKAAAVAMVKAMEPSQRKTFTVAFRHAFEVPAVERTIIPLIAEFRHLDFVDRFTGEAAGVVKP